MNTKSLGFIGGGRITKIFLQGFQNKKVKFPSIIVHDTNSEVLENLKKQFHEIQTTDSPTEAAGQDVVVLSLHPPVLREVLTKINGSVSPGTLILSLAPKISIDKIEDLLNVRMVARMIPNATSYINKGINPICFSTKFPADEKASMLETLKELGETYEVEENKLESYAIVSAMLPTYFWFQWKEMEIIAQKTGLPENESREVVYETLKVSLEIMYNSELNYQEMIDLIPVKPIGEKEDEIKEILHTKLLGLFEKIKP